MDSDDLLVVEVMFVHLNNKQIRIHVGNDYDLISSSLKFSWFPQLLYSFWKTTMYPYMRSLSKNYKDVVHFFSDDVIITFVLC